MGTSWQLSQVAPDIQVQKLGYMFLELIHKEFSYRNICLIKLFSYWDIMFLQM